MSRRVPGAAASALAGAGLGVPRVVFFVLCSLGPLLVVAGVVPTAFAATGLTAVAGAFLALGVVLGVFTAGYVAMARRVRNAGAFYALIAAGLGKSWGLAGWLVALVAYSLLQVGLYGIFGPQAAAFATDNLHATHPWWVYALGAWLLVAVLGLVRANLSSRILGVLLVCELIVILALDISGLTHPAPGGFDLTTLSPARLVSHGGGALLAIAVLGFVGFEQAPVYGEEARDPRRTVARATYACLALATAVYVLTPVAMAVHYGSGNLVTVAQAQGPGMLLGLNNGLFGHAGRLLFLTSVLAAAVAFHNAV
ncbi:MAG TPA: APC family permease, partial [Trebonia sp.]|nr:APC family permease [Trebonia sp.]